MRTHVLIMHYCILPDGIAIADQTELSPPAHLNGAVEVAQTNENQ